jgi:flagellar protein FlbD
MVPLTRLNGQPLVINSDLIKFVEQAPDTLITLVNGEKLMVRENSEEVVKLITEFRRSVLQGVFPAWDHVPNLGPVSGNPSAAKSSKG